MKLRPHDLQWPLECFIKWLTGGVSKHKQAFHTLLPRFNPVVVVVSSSIMYHISYNNNKKISCCTFLKIKPTYLTVRDLILPNAPRRKRLLTFIAVSPRRDEAVWTNSGDQSLVTSVTQSDITHWWWVNSCNILNIISSDMSWTAASSSIQSLAPVQKVTRLLLKVAARSNKVFKLATLAALWLNYSGFARL